MKKEIINGLKRIYKKLAVPVYRMEATLSKRIASSAHKKLFHAEWFFEPPESFDHDIDLYYQWEKTGRSWWLERGVFNNLALQMFDEAVLIELCCGEGFNTKYFYSANAKSIYACDYDVAVISEAKRKYKRDNICFAVADIRKDIPPTVKGEAPTNIIWDASIQYFTSYEIKEIMNRIHEVLEEKRGVLSGYSIVEDEGSNFEYHRSSFNGKEDLKGFFTPYFKNVYVFETVYKDRHNLYYYASDGELPFSEGWIHGI